MNVRFFIALAIAIFSVVSTAQAQNTQLQQTVPIINKLTPSGMAMIYQAMGFTTEMNEDGGVTYIKVAAPNGAGVFYTAMRDCDLSGCELVQPYGFFRAQGVTLSQLNNLHLEALGVATLVLMPEGRGMAATKIYLQGGISLDNFGFQLGVFIGDLDKVVASIRPGTLASIDVNNESATEGGVLMASVAGWPEGAAVNNVGANAADLVTTGVEKILNGAAPLSAYSINVLEE